MAKFVIVKDKWDQSDVHILFHVLLQLENDTIFGNSIVILGLSGSFRRIVAENGFSVVLQPSLALAHTTGSDLSQVELSFSKDATIIKTLVR